MGTYRFLQWRCLTAKLPEMVRPFTLRDLALVRRLSEQGVSLHAESALADNLHPLRGALFGMVARSDSPTLIWKSEDGERPALSSCSWKKIASTPISSTSALI